MADARRYGNLTTSVRPHARDRETGMKISTKSTAVGLITLAAAISALALGGASQGVSQASAEAPKVAGPARVDDFMLADQNLLARQLYRMSDDKAVVLVTYASGDKQL